LFVLPLHLPPLYVVGDTPAALRRIGVILGTSFERGPPIDPASCYFLLNPLFETSAEKYDWLNRTIAVGLGDRLL
jgi:hypothetical protein